MVGEVGVKSSSILEVVLLGWNGVSGTRDRPALCSASTPLHTLWPLKSSCILICILTSKSLAMVREVVGAREQHLGGRLAVIMVRRDRCNTITMMRRIRGCDATNARLRCDVCDERVCRRWLSSWRMVVICFEGFFQWSKRLGESHAMIWCQVVCVIDGRLILVDEIERTRPSIGEQINRTSRLDEINRMRSIGQWLRWQPHRFLDSGNDAAPPTKNDAASTNDATLMNNGGDAHGTDDRRTGEGAHLRGGRPVRAMRRGMLDSCCDEYVPEKYRAIACNEEGWLCIFWMVVNNWNKFRPHVMTVPWIATMKKNPCSSFHRVGRI
jgi:hypothetical protein